MQRAERPASAARIPLWSLSAAFLLIGAVALGGGGAAHIHSAMVRRRAWLTEEELLEGITFAQLTPGPNFSNLAMFVGAKLCGSWGAVTALLGVIVPGALVVTLLAVLYTHFPIQQHPMVQGLLAGVSSGAVGVLAVVVLRTLPVALRSRLGLALILSGLIAVGVFRWNIAWVLAVLLPVGLWANRPLQNVERQDG